MPETLVIELTAKSPVLSLLESLRETCGASDGIVITRYQIDFLISQLSKDNAAVTSAESERPSKK